MVLSQWLQIMLAEITRKREELQQGKDEERRRELARLGSGPSPEHAQATCAASMPCESVKHGTDGTTV
jgi:hypothetical protein